MPLIFLNGGAMRGGPLNHLLLDSPLVGRVRTAARYRFYSVRDRFPALDEVPAGGVSVSGELYDADWSVLRETLLPTEPAELELGVIELEDGTGCLSMIRRRTYREQPGALRDISSAPDWNAYRHTLTASHPEELQA
ncbi:MAG TPA: gamma-glutamylcyclotransferase [Actinospica sp.]|nr:gamma-glutamylcyclotransferase [Actinospica sp.]